MKIVVTGAAGFIGSNIIAGLNARGITQIIAVDDLTQGVVQVYYGTRYLQVVQVVQQHLHQLLVYQVLLRIM